MAIQSSVNQAIGAASIMAGLYSQSPMGKKRAELREIKQGQKVLDKQMELASEPLTNEAIKHTESLYRRQQSLAERKFELDPTDENYQTLENLYKEYEAMGFKGGEFEGEPESAAIMESEKSMTYEQLKMGAQKLALKKRAQLLKEVGHMQAQDKRAEQKRKYEESKK